MRGPTVSLLFGPPTNMMSGATVSTVNETVAGVGSVLPASSVACTENVWAPCARFVALNGEVQGCIDAPSRLHVYVTMFSFAVNEMLTLAIGTVPLGPAVIVVSGGVASITHVRVAGVGS